MALVTPMSSGIQASVISNNSNETETKKEMLSVRTEGGKHFVRINNSSLSIIQECPRKAYYKLHRELRGTGMSPALVFGSAIHKALETFYSGTADERVLPTNFKKNIEIMEGAELPNEKDNLLYRATRDFIEEARPLSNLPSEDKRSISTGIWILGHYFTTYIDDPYTVMVGESGPMTELFLEAIIYDSDDLQITLFGTIDVILQNLANGQVLIADHKTSSMVGNDFYNRLKPNHQYTGYVYLAQTCLGLTTDKFLVNCLQVKPKPKTSRGSGPHFPRQITTRSPEDIGEFRDSLIYFVRQYIQCMDSGVWPISQVNVCASYGGCEFLEVCSAPSSIRENIINAKYQEA